MRPIDADTLLERPIWFCGGWMGDSYAEGYMDALDKVEETIKSEPTIEMPRWIPCEERLPELKTECLITYLSWSGSPVIDIDSYDYDGKDGWFSHMDKVIAWMPLPEPYDGERKDDEGVLD